MILITGATGNFGKSTIDGLLKKGINHNEIAAFVRNEGKAEHLKSLGIKILTGDYNNYNSLTEAFKEADQLLFISSSDLEHRAEQQISVVKAAKEAGVKHIIYTSVDRKTVDENSPLAFVLTSHRVTEEAIKNSGMNYTILKNNLYLESLPWFLGQNVLETGIFFPAGTGKAGFVLRSEMAEAAANILINSNVHHNKEYILSSSNPLSFEEIAKIISEASGKNVGYISPDPQTYINTLTDHGMPKEYAVMFANFGQAIKEDEMSAEKSDMAELLEREPVSIESFLKDIYAAKEISNS